MKNRRLVWVIIALTATGCATSKVVHEGVNSVGDMHITAESAWISVSGPEMLRTNGASRTWTRSGIAGDRLILIAGIKDGESIFRSSGPVFRGDMSPAEIASFVQSSIPIAIGNSAATVRMNNIREQNFGLNAGLMFDFKGAAEGDERYQGIVGAFVHKGRLYVNLFLAADAKTYANTADDAEAVIRSAVTRVKTLGRY
ncbi:MAG: hypothetical protein BMS9Abin32_710 [Gammaproteobacteria bacterium]|nr:MAG: hypothetical protein BMS9Abin32_710 [Gammaproteobacteria bacterium]